MVKELIKNIMKDKTFLKNSMFVLIANTISNGVLFLNNIIISGMLEPSLFGSYKTTLYLFTLLPGLLDLGMMHTFPKFIAEYKKNKKLRIGSLVLWFINLRLISFVILILTLFVFKNQIADVFYHNNTLEPLIQVGIFVVFCSFFLFLRSIAIGYENFSLFSISTIISSLTFGVFGVVAAYKTGPVGVVFIYGLSSLLGSLIYLPFILKQKLFERKAKYDVKKIFIGYSLPIYIIYIPYSLGLSITPVLSIFFPQELIGYFSFAFMFYFAGSIIPSTISAVLFPQISRLKGENKNSEIKKGLKRALIIYSLLTFVGIIFVLLFSKMFLETFAPRYMPGLFMFKIITILGLLLGYFTIAISYYSALAKFKQTAILTVVENLILFIVCYFLLATF